MNCEEVNVWMQLELDGELPESDRLRLYDHLQQCPDCAALYQRLQLLSAELEQLPAVVPPFSIVDSIMPQLVSTGTELARQAAAEQGKPAKWFSWKLSAGAAAAAVVVAILLFHYGTPVRNSAQDLARTTNSASSAGSYPKESVSPKFNPGKAEGGAEDQYGPANVAPSTGDPSFGIMNSTTTKSIGSDKPVGSGQSDSQASSSTEHKNEITPEQTAAADRSAPKQLYQMSQATPAPSSVGGSSDGAGQRADLMPATPAASSAPAASTAPAKAAEPSPTPTSTPSPMMAPMGIAAVPSATPAQGGTNGSAATSASPSPTPITRSFALMRPAVQDNAVLQDGHVTILSADGHVVFRSAIAWLPTDTITFDWRSNTQLSYTVVREDQTRITYLIDLTHQTEQTQTK